MFAFLVAGLLLGVLAGGLHGARRPPQVWVTVPVGVGAALLGGVGTNLLLGHDWGEQATISGVAAIAVALGALGLLAYRYRRA